MSTLLTLCRKGGRFAAAATSVHAKRVATFSRNELFAKPVYGFRHGGESRVCGVILGLGFVAATASKVVSAECEDTTSREKLEAMPHSALVDLVLQLQRPEYDLALAELLHEIDHEVERLAAKVRSGTLTTEQAASEFVLQRTHGLLQELDQRANRGREGLYRDFRISPSPGWSISRRFTWGVSRLLGMSQNNHASDGECLYVDFTTAKSRRVSSSKGSLPPKPADTARFVLISDTHLRHRDLSMPSGDVLVHCGDVLLQGGDAQAADDKSMRRHLADFNNWLGEMQGTPEVVLIGGNHDVAFETLGQDELQKLIPNAKYLCHSKTRVANARLSLWGSGYSPGHGGGNCGFQHESDLKALGNIPSGGAVDILVTHGPPLLEHSHFNCDAKSGKTFGCKKLLNVVQNTVRPRLHVFGHDHNAHGAHRIGETLFICATSVIDGSLTAENPPIVVDVPIK